MNPKPSIQFTIRPYQGSDLHDVMSVWENASKIAHPFLTEEFLSQERYNIPNVYLPNADTWVTDHEGKVVGFIALLGNEVGAIFVQPEYHGVGLGWALMNKAQALHGDLEVEVFKENSIGQAFYARYGFEPVLEKHHEPTGQQVLRLKFIAAKDRS
ncbi:GNAT family N-acetyltransferase [Acaryochloris sp. IP29b_bin.137]|uniref:GNAT family N-acetyltransferase n=1 Tax=Acaryochloris sp. IP29b_bin.137 TaxID=2969217 RepID=UPI002624A449|nr:GNAT family N-acetyltransferase [Acaryochloris sp. IP29b_bin.137]